MSFKKCIKAKYVGCPRKLALITHWHIINLYKPKQRVWFSKFSENDTADKTNIYLMFFISLMYHVFELTSLKSETIIRRVTVTTKGWHYFWQGTDLEAKG